MPPSYGLNLPNKNSSQNRKKPVFAADDSDSDNGGDNASNAVEITTLGDVDGDPKPQPKPTSQPPKRKIPFGGGGAPPKKPTVKPLSKTSIFADPDDDDDQPPAPAQYGLSTKPGSGPNKEGRAYTDLSALRTSRKHAEEAQELDPSIYSYDAVYDSLHAKPEKKAAATASEGPRYMTSLMRSAEVRERDRLRARDRMLAREREAEGDEFADKEKFVTAAYKAQQEEMRRIEREEAEREKAEEERRRKNGTSGMVGFYRDMLSRGEEQHEAAVKAAEDAARRVQAGEVPAEEPAAAEKADEDAERVAEELNARGAHIAVNDEGQVVDKRQLLSAGLNVAPKPKAQQQGEGAAGARRAATPKFDFRSQRAAREGQRARQTEMIAEQLEARARQEEEAEAARQKEVAERSRSQKTEKDVSSARERYLARKREREAAKGK
ncbi:coiled-coil domain-containing protein 55-domain containing protein [Aspergillus ambiguus]|uniref:splicing regulator NSRP1-like domain-containing protein n=1 Tax=Aspergillus ambiguus TaxID=176160 RepID=UPI003CCCAC8D